jgi:alkylation response protein AidB-like acyl-CoA dehydrogenase
MQAFETEERVALVDAVQRLLRDKSTESDVRRTMETERGYDPDLWKQLADMGLLGLIVDTANGGSGGGPIELELVMEEIGAALLCSPFLSSAVLATALLNACGDETAKKRLLPALVSGDRIATAALTGEKGLWTRDDVSVAAAQAGDRWTLDGVASYVTHGQAADVLLVVASVGSDVGVFEVDAKAEGLQVAPLSTFDLTLRLAKLSFKSVRARRLGTAGWNVVKAALDLTLVALAGEQAGGARRSLDMTVEYGKNRIQFGRPIAGFQALKHMAADMLLESESATSAARNAAKQLAESGADADAAISLAAFACADAFTMVTATSIQMHGGIAFTWDYPAHLYFRRARADAQLFGNPSFHRERYLTTLGA